MAGVFDVFRGGVIFFGGFFGFLTRDEAVGFTGEKKRVSFKIKVGDGMLGGEFGRPESVGAASIVCTTKIGSF